MRGRKFISLILSMTMIISMLSGLGLTASAEGFDENLYAIYTFNEVMTGVSRTTAADRSGNGHHARLNGYVKYVADEERHSKVLYTSGTNGSYMEFNLPTDESDNVLESFTVSMDMKNLTTGNYFNFYVGDGSSNGTGKNYFGYKMATDILLSAKTTSEKKTTLSGKGKNNAWVHVDFVIDNGTATIYVDKQSVGFLTGYNMSDINASVGRLSFSAWAADVYAKCYYDNVAIYDKAFTATEISGLTVFEDTEDNYEELEPSTDEYKITSEKGVDIQDGMIGLFFEDINYAADGGLYAEMIENRSFEARKYTSGSNTIYDGTYSWSVYPSAGSGASLTTSSNGGIDTVNNPNYAVFTASQTQNGLQNNAYDGVLMEKGKTYNVSLYAKSDSYSGGISVKVYKDGETVAHAKVTDAVSNEWKKYEVVMTADKTARCADFVIEIDTAGTVSLDMISCFPEDCVKGIFRKDLAEKLKAVNPGFLRFPGGCIIEGYNLANRYNWKDTLGDVAYRKQNWNRWMAHTNDGLDGGYKHYNQTYGLGFYEYFLLCEYLECRAVPVVNVGMACQYQSGETVAVSSAAFQQYIQDALDLIEFANGDASTTYGKIRADMGHPEPFNLEIIGIGNEQWQTSSNDWFTRYEKFEEAIHEKYPDMKLVATSGPGVQDDGYYAAWEWLREKSKTNENFAYVVDEHYYRTPDWFYSNMNFYDSYPRDVKVFAGEYASRRRNWSNDPAANTWEAALSEAAYLTMVERNADVVYMASYAPLFARINYTQWSPDMIWFDDANSYGSPTYYVQKLYSNNMGTYTLKSTLANYGTEHGVYSSASYDTESGDIIIKIANSNDTEHTIPIELEGFEINGTAEAQCIEADKELWNTISKPELVSPKTSVITDFENTYDYTVPASSFTVLRIGTTDEKTADTSGEPQVLTPPAAVNDKYQAMVYTTDTSASGGSIHIAVSDDSGNSFKDVNHGLGVVNAEAENGVTKAIQSPSVFKMDDDTYGIIAIRTEPSQAADCDNRDGSFMLYTTKDFISFANEGFRSVDTKRLNNIACDNDNGTYTISWTDEKGIRMSVTTTDFEEFTKQKKSTRAYAMAEGMDGAAAASTVGITEDMYNELLNSETETKYNQYHVDINHTNGNILSDTYDTVFDASNISGSYNDYNITTDVDGILPGWESTWNGASDEATASKQMNANLKTVNQKQYFQFYGPANATPVSIYTPGYARGADWFAIEFTLNASTTVGCHDSILLDLDKKPFFGYAYAKYNDGFYPGDGERHYNDDGSMKSVLNGQLSNFLAEVGGANCTYTNEKTVVRVIVDNGAVYNDTDAYAVTTAYSNDGASFTTINTRYYSGSVNGFGGIAAGALANSSHWYDNTRYGNVKVYSSKNGENPVPTKDAPNITAVSGNGIKSYGVEIDTANRTIFIPVHVGCDIDNLSPEFTCKSPATVTLKSGTYADGVITVTDAEDASLTADWKVTSEERGNAVLDGYYADPNITVFDGKYYIYPTTDGGSSWEAPNFKCFSSDDLVHWKDEGVILDLKDVGWSNGYNGWAPTITEKNGKYYFYYSAAPSTGGAKNLAVAVSDSPTGPFEDKGIIARGGSLSGQMIDSVVFTDDDGQSYLYWGNGALYGAKLSEDMLSIEGDIVTLTPSNFREGAFMIKRNGVYYMMWSQDDTGSPNYHVRYGTMTEPLGKISGSTQILHKDNATSSKIKGTGHHSVINIPGTDEWYICYHRFNTGLYGNTSSNTGAGNHREVCIDKMEFDEKGNIKTVTPTLEGITEPVYLAGGLIGVPEITVKDGVLSWSLARIGDISDADIYTALYDTNDTLVLAKKNEMNGSFTINPQLDYTLKVFTWKKNTIEPIGKAYPQKRIKGDTKLSKLAAELAPDTEIRGNQYMPAVYDDVHITWTSDNSAVKPDGTVKRGGSDTEVNITAVFSKDTDTLEKTYTSTVKAAPEGKTEADMDAYLFVHFVGTEGDAESEQIYFSVSKDGQNWETLNNNTPILTSALGEMGVRDPHIVRSPEGDKFFLIATDLSIYNRRGDSNRWGTCQTSGSQYIMIWESTDLVNWSKQRMIKVAVSNAGCTWAPESIYDNEKGQYMVFWASKVSDDNYATQRIYRSYTTDFEHFTDPEVYIDDGNISNIDTTFINYDGEYYRFTKNESKSSVTMMKSDNLDSGFTNVSTYTINGTAGNTVTGYEGPTIYKLNGENKWCLLLDYYSKSQGYKPFMTDDITKGVFTSAADFNFDTKYRHGTVMPITLDEYKALVGAYSEVSVSGTSRIVIGDTEKYTGLINGAEAAAQWSVSDDTKAEIDNSGNLTAKAAGEVTVTAYLTEYGITAEKKIEIVTEIPADEVGLAAYLTFDEENTGKGTFNATIGGSVKETGTVSYADGKNGKALSLTYGTGNYLELPDGILNGATEASVSFWLKQNSYTENSWAFMTTPVTGKQTYKSEKYLGILLDKAQNKMTVERYCSNNEARPTQLTASGSFGNWNYITVNFDADKTILYVNGTKTAEMTSSVNLASLFTAGAKTWIGYGNWESGQGLAGMIDDFRLYDRLLSETEITQLMNVE